MVMKFRKVAALLSATAIASLSAPAVAQTVGPTEQSEVTNENDIVVTARKRNERALDVPAVISAIGAEELQEYNLNTIEDVASRVPQLIVSTVSTSNQGIIGLRGVSTGAGINAADQAVAINVDGVQASHALALQMGQIDLEAVEVLKGPQALFFGKNSPGGVITLRTANPGSDLFTQVRMGYEFNAKGKFAEAIVSGPLSDTIGARLVGYASDQSGAFRNVANEALSGPIFDRTGPDFRQLFGRLTLVYEPTSSFSASLKLSRFDKQGNGYTAGVQEFNCPTGASLIKPSDTCKLDEEFVMADPVDNLAGVEPLFRDGNPYMDIDAASASLQMNLDLGRVLLTSVTGYFDADQSSLANLSLGREQVTTMGTPPRRVGSFFTFAMATSYRTFSQELRLATQFEGPLNLVLGGYVDDTQFDYAATAQFNTTIYPQVNSTQDGRAYSGFGQVIVDVTPQVELTAGGRYTYERRQISGFRGSVPLLYDPNQITSNNFSPELTARWQPNRDVTVFAAYKKGYKSGGLSINFIKAQTVLPTTPSDLSFGPENVEGGEVGIKTSLANGRVHLNLAGYYYQYSDLQVSIQGDASNPSNDVFNAGKATVKGIEFDGSWNLRNGLTLTGAVAFNLARYDVFTPNCYRLQTFAQGCNLDRDQNGTFESQNVAGRPLERAPKWSGNLGFRYESQLSEGLAMRLNGQLSYSSSYETEGKLNPLGRQGAYATVDGGVAVRDSAASWELALIGRNLTNKIVAIRSNEDSASPPGATSLYGNVSNPRTITLQLTLRPDQLF